MNEILRMENVSHTYHSDEGETLAIKDISLSVAEGEFVAIIGPSGCGKTTILSMIAGLIKPTAGKIILDGKEVERPGEDIGYMFQRDQLLPWRKIWKNVLLGLEIKKILTPENIKYADELLEKYGLGEFKQHYPFQLSGGMKQRAALIRTLAFKPKVLLLDEPFSALDYQTRLNVCNDVYAIIRTEGKTAILVTHDIAEAISLADRIIVLSKRPGTIKSEYRPELGSVQSPLKRREHASFRKLFEKIWRDISDEEQMQ